MPDTFCLRRGMSVGQAPAPGHLLLRSKSELLSLSRSLGWQMGD